MNNQIDSWIESTKEKLIQFRRMFHRSPEEGWTEYVTTSRIYTELKTLGFKLYIGEEAIDSNSRYGVPNQEMLDSASARAMEFGVPDELLYQLEGGHTGVIAVLDTGRPGPHLACRFDIDGLPIEEPEESLHFPASESFQSNQQGKMHACGHDGHTAIGLAFAHYLSEKKDVFCGKMTLLFQPAEEGCRGARAMVDKGWLDDVDYFVGSHIGIHDLSVGEVASTTTKFLATTKFDLTFNGEATHAGARPESGRNALVAAASFIQGSYGISRHSGGSTRVNIGTLKAGSGRNVIADHAFIQGEVRGETTELNTYMYQELKRIAEGAATIANVEAKLTAVGQGESGVCDEEWKQLIKRAARRTSYIQTIHDQLPLGASEDVSSMMKRVQSRGGIATFMLIGTDLPYGHHHPSFDFEEGALKVGLSAFMSIVNELSLNE